MLGHGNSFGSSKLPLPYKPHDCGFIYPLHCRSYVRYDLCIRYEPFKATAIRRFVSFHPCMHLPAPPTARLGSVQLPAKRKFASPDLSGLARGGGVADSSTFIN